MEVTNPSVSEIRNWAYSTTDWPHDEWDLFLSWTKEVDLFIELATDHNCPNQKFFLHMLYYIVGTTFSQPGNSDKFDRIRSYSDKGRATNHGYIRVWRAHIDDLLKERVSYEYENWRGGKLAGYGF